MTQPAAISQPQTVRPAAHIRSAGWVARRALIGILTLSVIVLSGAWLLYASIDSDGTVIADQSQSE